MDAATDRSKELLDYGETLGLMRAYNAALKAGATYEVLRAIDEKLRAVGQPFTTEAK